MGNGQSIVTTPSDLQCAEGCDQPNCGHSKFASHGSPGQPATQSVNSFTTAAGVYCYKHSYTMEKDRLGIYHCFYCDLEHGVEHDPSSDPLSDIRSTVALERTNLAAPAPAALGTGIQRMGSSTIGPTIPSLKKPAPVASLARQSQLPQLSRAEQFKLMSRDEQMANLDIGNGAPGDAHHHSAASGIPRPTKRGGKK
ncbi:uncharacterized protein LOC62_02G003423 [Vanrija pseudolonga]|uniref:Uncharacterized protein n=1 Tax=Vanrija pseudolonga TaxID=143232 RepID=A0AAF0Y866_9TREE|nr:hypothetical protein LOC62_02G003423 [Vanrija pseudolonga]